MKRRVTGLTFMVCALIAVVGCASDDPTLAPGELSKAQVDDIVQDVVAPTLEVLDFRSFTSAKSLVPKGGSECTDISQGCLSGSAEVCADQQSATIAFDQCVTDDDTVDGSITVSGGETSGSIAFDISAGGTAMAGSVAYAIEGDCLTETLTALTVTTPTVITSMSGSIQYCGSSWPSGTLNVSTTGAAFGSYLFELVTDGTPTALLTVDDLSTNALVASCSVDLANETAQCTFGNID